jgi:hypothetical protein
VEIVEWKSEREREKTTKVGKEKCIDTFSDSAGGGISFSAR